jgi:phosphoserine aminotransferase
VADFTSTLLSRPVDVTRYGVIYASSGKNLGPSGFAVVIVRRDLLGQARPATPSILDWSRLAEPSPIPSLYNTPTTFSLYVCSLVLEDLIARGGLEAAEQRAIARAARVYEEIDRSEGFYTNTIHHKHRSRMNVPFRIRGGDPLLEARFVEEAERRGLHQLFGHPRFGGLRASLYNGVSDEAIDALAAFLPAFRRDAGG